MSMHVGPNFPKNLASPGPMLQFSFRPCLEGIFASTYLPKNGFYYLTNQEPLPAYQAPPCINCLAATDYPPYLQDLFFTRYFMKVINHVLINIPSDGQMFEELEHPPICSVCLPITSLKWSKLVLLFSSK
jgi:hypothetical protein